jgi:hypothetical protein
MNRLARFLAGTNKWMANDPLFSTAQRLVFTLASCCQVDHFDFRVPHFASGKQLPVRVGPNEKRIRIGSPERFGNRHPRNPAAGCADGPDVIN